MTTGRDVYKAAIALMDSMSSTGQPITEDNLEYQYRAPFILNILRGELYPYSDTYISATAGTRPISAVITSLSSDLPIDDFLAQTIMPYGLAAHLLLDENPSAASFFQQRYDELIKRYGSGVPAESEAITDLYGGIGFYEE